jgi:DNA primase
MAERWEIGWMPENSRVFLDWARSKNFTGKDLVASGLASLKDEDRPANGIYVRFRDRLMFPIRNEVGDAIAFSGRQLKEDPRSGKYINSPETDIFKKSNVLFALDRAKKAILKEKAVILCEGQIDAIACHEGGVENAIAPLGTAFTSQHARILKRYAQTAVLCFDADNAGVKACERAFRELAPEGFSVKVVELPAGDDPDTYLKAHGVEGFRKQVADARDFFDFKIGSGRKNGRLETAEGRTELRPAFPQRAVRDPPRGETMGRRHRSVRKNLGRLPGPHLERRRERLRRRTPQKRTARPPQGNGSQPRRHRGRTPGRRADLRNAFLHRPPETGHCGEGLPAGTRPFPRTHARTLGGSQGNRRPLALDGPFLLQRRTPPGN